MRLTVSVAFTVCRLESTRCPVSAAESAAADRFGISHLADEDHVGVLAQDAPQGDPEVIGVDADLALGHEASLGLVPELDRVLDGEDVAVPGLVDVVDHRGERRRLPDADPTGDEHEATRLLREHADDGGRPSSRWTARPLDPAHDDATVSC